MSDCYDCKKENIKPFSNGCDGKQRCESCAVAKYEESPFAYISLYKNPMMGIVNASQT